MTGNAQEQPAGGNCRQCLQLLNSETLRCEVVKLRELVSSDHLTAVLSRAALEEAGQREVIRQERYGHPSSLVYCDLDHFKSVNDRLGHAVGDQVLREFARRLKTASRTLDSVGRLGGEEFAVVLPNTGLAGARTLAERMREELAATPVEPAGPVTASFGVAQLGTGESWADWVARADAAMYEAKHTGRNRVVAAVSHKEPHCESVAGGFLQLVWRDAYASGHPLIDEQHRALFAAANEALDCALGGDRKRLLELLARILEDCRAHFRDEEAILSELGWTDTALHRKVHARLLERAAALHDRYEKKQGDVGELVNFLARDVVALHILKEDRRWFPQLAGAARSGSSDDTAGTAPAAGARREPACG